ncbi:MAG: DUF1284 domain-containing protein [Chloroflexi bacterium]|nr:DUF1284 domain-containing protein [Chloroflexota bacterium]
MTHGTIQIRGHHLLCAPRFVGRGYSPAFVRSMGALLARLKLGRALALLVTAPDAICRSCPNLQEGVCADTGPDAERIRALQDSYVLDGLGIEPGSEVYWREIEHLIERPMFDVDFVCRDCRWREICWQSGHGGRNEQVQAF